MKYFREKKKEGKRKTRQPRIREGGSKTSKKNVPTDQVGNSQSKKKVLNREKEVQGKKGTTTRRGAGNTKKGAKRTLNKIWGDEKNIRKGSHNRMKGENHTKNRKYEEQTTCISAGQEHRTGKKNKRTRSTSTGK